VWRALVVAGLVSVSCGGSSPAVAADARVVDAAHIDAAHVDAAQVDARTIDATPIDAAHIDALHIDAAHVDARPIDATPIDATPIDARPIDALPIDARPPDASCDAGAFGPPDAGSARVRYDDVVLADQPVAYWALANPGGLELDLSGNGNLGTYIGPATATALPDGDPAAAFGGSGYLTVASSAAFSITTTGSLTWEAWIRPDALELAHTDGYVNWMGKCQDYSPTCEWEARLYDATTIPARCDRFSAYAFNPTAGLGAGADWQPACGLFQDGQWHHVVGQYTTLAQPADCPNDPAHPGAIDIWVDGVQWDQPVHSPTGCMSEFAVAPVANDSPLDIGTSAFDTFFTGAIGKVALYDHALTGAQIAAHYAAMTGAQPTGSCAATCTIP
jgi:hypothetical protein